MGLRGPSQAFRRTREADEYRTSDPPAGRAEGKRTSAA